MEQDLPEDFFTDDLDLDDLPPNTLVELEQSAFQSTQALRSHNRNVAIPESPSSDYGLEDEDVIDLDAEQPHVEIRQHGIPTRPADEVTQREQWRQQRYSGQSAYLHQQQESNYIPDPEKTQPQHQPVIASAIYQLGSQPISQNVNTLDAGALQLRIAEVSKQSSTILI